MLAGNTPLHLATWFGRIEAVKMLLEHGNNSSAFSTIIPSPKSKEPHSCLARSLSSLHSSQPFYDPSPSLGNNPLQTTTASLVCAVLCNIWSCIFFEDPIKSQRKLKNNANRMLRCRIWIRHEMDPCHVVFKYDSITWHDWLIRCLNQREESGGQLPTCLVSAP